MYKELLTKPQTPEFTARILSYEIGDIHRYMIYQERFGPVGYIGNLKASCADAMTMIGLLCEQLGFDLNEVEDFGLERFKERMREVESGHQ
jgi:hypothetical protein